MKWWLILRLDRAPCLPDKETTVQFMGHSLVLRPPTRGVAADIRVRFETPGSDIEPACRRKAYEVVLRYLSALCWATQEPACPGISTVCTSPLRLGGVTAYPHIAPGHTPPELKAHSRKEALLALALYREARGVDNVPYEFLGYCKIINVLHKTGLNQKTWINSTIDKISDAKATKRIADLRKRQQDVGEYLYESGRCAVAHAHDEPLVDPDDPTDLLRLDEDMPVARALAEYLIEHELNVERP